MVVNTDLDCLIYRSLYGCKGDFIQTVELLDGFLHSINEKLSPSDHKLILSGATNFRNEVDPNYKISRKDKPKPRYYKALREYAIHELGAFVTVDKEADDELGILQNSDTCAASIDKDILQLPGYHYRFKRNWEDNELVYVTEDEAWFNFFKQVAMGDGVDDIAGLKGIGVAKATKALQDKTKEEMLETVQGMYKKQFGDDWFKPFDITCRLIFIQRSNAQNYFDLI
jgi:5''-3'' exonuclease (including N-terminal domain of PolI)